MFDDTETLPEKTETGKNSFGCFVNGRLVQIRHTQLSRAETQGNFFFLRFSNTVDNQLYADPIKNFSFKITKDILENVSYDLTNIDLYNVQYTDFIDAKPNCIYNSSDITKGTITFSKIDRTKYIISGTFEFEGSTQNCVDIKVTDGRFDMKYFPY
ncbi:hypothetical protein I602_2046 [Polaribacter dokdonensis DSW-5]|uniref:Uncharacterized protein n=1 Tax=Polaribacter dokdonensis DSW-5 TaxID=1300348 RepID=A0A0M9CHE6_9FLAO|nr:hypothetical protein I602_2046 [Polaribacter dokdonensis DSW-5]